MNRLPLAVPLFVLLGLVALGLAGCVPRGTVTREDTVPERPIETRPIWQYEALPGRDADEVARLRVAAPPEQAEVTEGRDPTRDQSRLAMQGYVQIGSGRYTGDDALGLERAREEGRRVGAEKILYYRGDMADGFAASYYVRFKLPFGATFRDLSAAERERLGVDGGVQIGSVVGGSAASRGNLMAGDYVLAVDGKPLADKGQFQQVLRAGVGRSLTLTIWRNGQRIDRLVRLDTPH